MSDPTRLLSAHSDAEALERALLESLQDAAPPPDAKAAMWRQLAVQLAAVTAVSAGSAIGVSAAASSAVGGASAASGAGAASLPVAAGSAVAPKAVGLAALVPKTLLAKVVLVGALGGAGGTALWLRQAPAARPTSAANHVAAPAPTTPARPRVLEAPAQEPLAVPEIRSVEPETARRAPRRERAARGVPKPPTTDALARESRLLTTARAALRAGDLQATQALLARLSSEFAAGELRQERDVLQIELLAARGEAVQATQAARRFVAAHPDSPHSAKLSRYLR